MAGICFTKSWTLPGFVVHPAALVFSCVPHALSSFCQYVLFIVVVAYMPYQVMFLILLYTGKHSNTIL